MSLTLEAGDIALRILLACLAGAIVGFNREADNQAAGLRTTMLVCLAACLAMVLANLLLPTSGRAPDAFTQMDVMRLPLGILSGMGFLGAGAIIRRGEAVHGVTTAAILWFMTVVGICFGAGQLWLGAAGVTLAYVATTGLAWADRNLRRKQRGVLMVRFEGEPRGEGVRHILTKAGYVVTGWAVVFQAGSPASFEVTAEVEWQDVAEGRALAPAFLDQLTEIKTVKSVVWRPRAVSA